MSRLDGAGRKKEPRMQRGSWKGIAIFAIAAAYCRGRAQGIGLPPPPPPQPDQPAVLRTLRVAL